MVRRMFATSYHGVCAYRDIQKSDQQFSGVTLCHAKGRPDRVLTYPLPFTIAERLYRS